MHFLVVKLAFGHLMQKKISRFFVVMSVSAILLMNSFLFMLYQHLGQSFTELKEARFVTAFVKPEADEARVPEIVSAIEKSPGVIHTQVVSREEFRKRFSTLFPESQIGVEEVDEEAIPRYIKVRVQKNDATPLVVKLKENALIESVETSQQKLSGVFEALTKFRHVVLGLVLFMSLALVSLILNHFKLSTQLTVQMRRALYSLGAKKRLMLVPFFIEGLAEGGLAGTIAALSLILVGSRFEVQMNHVSKALGYMPHQYELLPMALAVLVCGIGLGVAGSLWAMVQTKN